MAAAVNKILCRHFLSPKSVHTSKPSNFQIILPERYFHILPKATSCGRSFLSNDVKFCEFELKILFNPNIESI